MEGPKELPRDIGEFIRDLRRNARISLRQLAQQAGVSNPYLSQVERGLRKPSAEVLQQLASALRVSTPVMYLRAGLLDAKDGQGVLAAIAVDPDLTMAQKQSLSQIYETFRRENLRSAPEAATGQAGTAEAKPAEPPAEPAERPKPAVRRIKVEVDRQGQDEPDTPTEQPETAAEGDAAPVATSEEEQR